MPFGFRRLAGRASGLAGSPLAFAVALGIVVLWALTGPLFHFSDTWQLVINTGTTICTFLLGFLIQYMQNLSAEKVDRMLAHLDGLVSVDHAEHGRLLREIHAHTHCTGHTIIESPDEHATAERPTMVLPVLASEGQPLRDPHTGRYAKAAQ